ncbi:hypothetical protein BT69DRAFT_329865 [Atractiella rhizophila]|nr:hypothetical protein BT69DRAFT_329865 [Atractiella rhizophila]
MPQLFPSATIDPLSQFSRSDPDPFKEMVVPNDFRANLKSPTLHNNIIAPLSLADNVQIPPFLKPAVNTPSLSKLQTNLHPGADASKPQSAAATLAFNPAMFPLSPTSPSLGQPFSAFPSSQRVPGPISPRPDLPLILQPRAQCRTERGSEGNPLCQTFFSGVRCFPPRSSQTYSRSFGFVTHRSPPARLFAIAAFRGRKSPRTFKKFAGYFRSKS